MPAILHSPTPHARRKVTSRLKSRMGWEMPWYTVTDSFDADFGVDQWHGHNAFIRDGDKAFRTYSVNGRGGHDRGSIGQAGIGARDVQYAPGEALRSRMEARPPGSGTG